MITSPSSPIFATLCAEPADSSRARRTPGKLDHLLLCLDGSPRGEVALGHAMVLATTFGARVTLLHVMQPRDGGASPMDAFGWEFARQRAHGYLDRLEKRLRESGVDAETVVAEGCPATRIAALTTEIGADLVVLAAHGEGGSDAFEMGGTVQQLLSIARGSVLVARDPVSARPSTIVVPLDGSARTECVIPAAVRIAKQNAASLTLVHVVSEPVRSSILAADDLDLARNLAQRLEAGAQIYLDHVKQQISHEVQGIRTVVLRDEHPQQALVDFAEREGADLVVVAAHGTTCNATLTCGSTASFLLAHARPALLMIQDVAATEQSRRDSGTRTSGAVPRTTYRVVAA